MVYLCQFFFSWDNHQISDEKSMIGSGGKDSNLYSIFGIPADVSISDIELWAGVEVVDGDIFQKFVGFGRLGNVDFTPPDILLKIKIKP
jgi:hypothetical protein